MSEVQGETVVEETPQSTVLNETEVQETLSAPEEGEGQVEENVTLPSDEASFEMPEKFKDKSAEEIAKAYMELEKMKASKEDTPTEEAPTDDDTEGGGPKDIDTSKYLEAYEKNGELSEQDYKELEEAGYSKEEVDEQIEFIEYKRAKEEKAILGDIDKQVYLEAAQKASEAWGPDKIAQFNNDLAEASTQTQQMLVKSLVAEFGSTDSTPTPTTLHTNEVQTQPTKGYSNRSELLADIADPRYETDKAFNQAVEAKLALTDDSGW